MWMGLLDVICFSAIHYSIGHASIQVGLLFVVTIFVLNLVQTKRIGILLTLASIISVVYLPFIGVFFKHDDGEHILNSALLTIMFVVVCTLANLTVGRYRKLQKINQDKTDKLKQLQDVAFKIMQKVDTGYMVLNNEHELILVNDAAQKAINLSIGSRLPFDELDPVFAKNYLAKINGDESSDVFVCDLNGSHYFVGVQRYKSTHDLSVITLEDSNRVNERLLNLKLAALGQISASIAHEIRNPLSTIGQAVGLIIGSDQIRVERYCGIIKKQCDRIDGIIQSTLDMAKNKSIEPKSLSVDAVLAALISEDLMELQDKIKVLGEADLHVLVDELHLRQILTNLIKNAVRHNNFDISPVIEVRLSSFDQIVNIEVRDFGEGVKPEMVEKLFKPFFSTEVDGTGLGLYLVKSLCETNKARIEYVECDVGACFRVVCLRAY